MNTCANYVDYDFTSDQWEKYCYDKGAQSHGSGGSRGYSLIFVHNFFNVLKYFIFLFVFNCDLISICCEKFCSVGVEFVTAYIVVLITSNSLETLLFAECWWKVKTSFILASRFVFKLFAFRVGACSNKLF